MGSTCAERLREHADFVLSGARSEQVRRMGRQVHAATGAYAREYAGRFLLELLQNGYDAHSKGCRDGRVHVLLDADEGECFQPERGSGALSGPYAPVLLVLQPSRSGQPRLHRPLPFAGRTARTTPGS